MRARASTLRASRAKTKGSARKRSLPILPASRPAARTAYIFFIFFILWWRLAFDIFGAL
jgi:hypothetical protein